jgi:putative pyruvate formate lyase activating enzyme
MNLANCNICPRNCNVNRYKEVGFCKINAKPKIYSYFAHFGEESVLVCNRGSGTIFFSGCNLGCVFCQNYEISHFCEGEEISIRELAEIFKYLDNNCENINLVTPTHQVPFIIDALKIYKPKNPVIYNTSGYEKIETLKIVKNFVDIYMPDIKFFSYESSRKYLNAEDYPEIVKKAVKEMYSQKGELKIINGKAIKGVLIRHLVMPNHIEDSKEILEWIKKNCPKAGVNIMNQYYPCYKANLFPEINRRIYKEEYLEVLEYAITLGLNIIK